MILLVIFNINFEKQEYFHRILFFQIKKPLSCHLQKNLNVFPSTKVYKLGSVFRNFIAGVTALLLVESNREIFLRMYCL